MINDETKRAIKKCLTANGFDSTIVDELIIERKQLRDEFAIAVLTGVTSRGGVQFIEQTTATAYKYADAMIKARNTNN